MKKENRQLEERCRENDKELETIRQSLKSAKSLHRAELESVMEKSANDFHKKSDEHQKAYEARLETNWSTVAHLQKVSNSFFVETE